MYSCKLTIFRLVSRYKSFISRGTTFGCLRGWSAISGVMGSFWWRGRAGIGGGVLWGRVGYLWGRRRVRLAGGLEGIGDGDSSGEVNTRGDGDAAILFCAFLFQTAQGIVASRNLWNRIRTTRVNLSHRIYEQYTAIAEIIGCETSVCWLLVAQFRPTYWAILNGVKMVSYSWSQSIVMEIRSDRKIW